MPHLRLPVEHMAPDSMLQQQAADEGFAANGQMDFAHNNVIFVLQDLFTQLQKEFVAAAVCHHELATKVLEQQQACTSQLSEISHGLSALLPSSSLVPQSEAFLLAEPMASEFPTAPAGKIMEATFGCDPSLRHADRGEDASAVARPSEEFASQVLFEEELPIGEPSSQKLSRDSQLSKLIKTHSADFQKLKESVFQTWSWSAIKALLGYIVAHSRFERCTAALIVANALVLCFEVQYHGLQIGYDLKFSGCELEAIAIWPAALVAFKTFDWVFGLLLLLEAIMKLIPSVRRYFSDAWNWLDLAIVWAFLTEQLAAQVIPFDVKALRLLRFTRLMRVVRIIRALEECHQLYIMTTAIKGMFMVVVWAAILMSVIVMTEALFLTQFLHAFYFKHFPAADLSEAELVSRHKLYEYFGSFSRCFLSMFELTLANWTPVTRLLSEEVSEWLMPMCLIHKVTVGLGVVGVISGVIMQETFKVALTDDWIMMRQKRKATETMKLKMRDLFLSLDVNKDGTVKWEEFKNIAEHPEIKDWLASMEFDTHDLRTLFVLVDHDNTDSINLEELIQRMPLVKGPARTIDVLELKRDLGR